jgi:hypothetical protein
MWCTPNIKDGELFIYFLYLMTNEIYYVTLIKKE